MQRIALPLLTVLWMTAAHAASISSGDFAQGICNEKAAQSAMTDENIGPPPPKTHSNPHPSPPATTNNRDIIIRKKSTNVFIHKQSGSSEAKNNIGGIKE